MRLYVWWLQFGVRVWYPGQQGLNQSAMSSFSNQCRQSPAGGGSASNLKSQRESKARFLRQTVNLAGMKTGLWNGLLKIKGYLITNYLKIPSRHILRHKNTPTLSFDLCLIWFPTKNIKQISCKLNKINVFHYLGQYKTDIIQIIPIYKIYFG